MVLHKAKQISLVVCLFIFLLVVLGGGLHLSPAGALLAAATGTPLSIHVFNRWSRASSSKGSAKLVEPSSSSHRSVKPDSRGAPAFETRDAIRQ